jgi:hypothetical protein
MRAPLRILIAALALVSIVGAPAAAAEAPLFENRPTISVEATSASPLSTSVITAHVRRPAATGWAFATIHWQSVPSQTIVLRRSPSINGTRFIGTVTVPSCEQRGFVTVEVVARTAAGISRGRGIMMVTPFVSFREPDCPVASRP